MIPQNSLDSLEFGRLLEIIAQNAKSDASQSAILSITPLKSKDEIIERFSLIEEIRRLSQKGKPLNVLPFKDILPVLQRVRPEDAILEPLELSWLMDFLRAANEASMQIKGEPSLLTLNELVKGLTGKPELLRILERSIDREGNILDSASPILSELRARKRQLESKIRKRLEEIINDERIVVFLQDRFITQRSGRWVIPVRMDSKGQVSGVVHDVSKSGETAFIEPLGIISLSNELENIIADEKAKEIRILKELSSRIRNVASEIEEEFRIIVYLDILRSITIFAEEFNMQIPIINEQDTIHLVKAKHPLLLHAAMKDELQEVIPNDILLGEDSTVMVITGPNAGGKTVIIKTIGLLSLMALSGIPVTADSSSTMPLFRNILVDIGDRQSIEYNLSTFTAHLENIMEILKGASPKTLVLIDELGTGTDPEEGAALSCAILRKLKENDAMAFATTHLTDIKAFVHRSEGMLNASMEFDHETLTPLYRLRIGEPGQSFALETAKGYGLPESIIESAKTILGKRKADLENLIQDLNEKRRHYEEALKELGREIEEVKESESQIKELLKNAESKTKEILSKAYKEASDIIHNTKRQMHSLLEEFKKSDKGKAKEFLREVMSAENQVAEKIRQYGEAEPEILSIDELGEGDTVFVKSIGYDATIVKILKKDNRLKVRIGNREIEVPISDVGLKKGKPVEVGTEDIKVDILEEAIATQVNLRGLRVDEAISRLEHFLNHAALTGLSEVIIIHGIGTGRLGKALREYLSNHPLVKGFRDGTQSEGGAGITVVTLK